MDHKQNITSFSLHVIRKNFTKISTSHSKCSESLKSKLCFCQTLENDMKNIEEKLNNPFYLLRNKVIEKTQYLKSLTLKLNELKHFMKNNSNKIKFMYIIQIKQSDFAINYDK